MKTPIPYIILSFIFLISSAQGSERLAYSDQWLNLLHYKKSWGGYQSEADGSGFFFDKKTGRKNPKNELLANIKAMSAPALKGQENKHPRCLFPSRAYFLLKEKLIGPQKFRCTDFEVFFKRLNAPSMSLVFSSYYLNTPASAFGHTLLKFNRTADNPRGRNDLLDYASNYAASVTTQNALLYAIYGLFGGFRGEFTAMPYFYKVREYNDFESRDLWEYEIQITKLEIYKLISHLWEMKQTFFTYYYLTENCSYHMLGLLDVANPSWKLTKRLPTIVAPVDTVRVLAETPGLVKKIHYSPSLLKKTKMRIDALSSNEKESLDSWIDDEFSESRPKSWSSKKQINLLDAAIDYFDYKNPQELLNSNNATAKKKRKLLAYRAKTGKRSEQTTIAMPKIELPHIGHPTRRLLFTQGKADKSKGFSTLEYRFALHDFSDPISGHNPYSLMEMFRIKVRAHYQGPYKEKLKFYLDDFSLFEVVSLTPMESFFPSFSWRAQIGPTLIRNRNCSYCFAPIGSKLLGGLSFGNERFLGYGLLGAGLTISKRLKENIELHPMANMGLIIRWNSRISTHLEGSYRYSFFTDFPHIIDYKMDTKIGFNKSWAFLLSGRKLPLEWEAEAGLSYYF